VGAGCGGIARWLAERVGPRGQVVATDIDTRYLTGWPAGGGRARLDVVRHDVTVDPRPGERFDLVHARMVLAHLPERDAVVGRLASWLAPGGALVVEDIDYALLGYHPVLPAPAFEAVVAAVLDYLRPRSTFEPAFGRRLPGLLRGHGLTDVRSEWRSVLIQGGSPEVAYVTAGLEQVRDGLVAAGLVSAAQVEEAMTSCANPSFAVMTPLLVSAWGRIPA